MTPFDFSFPLNVYFALLQWEEQRVDALHFGLFEHADDSIHRVQARASERFWAQIPEEGRVLEVGVGLGDTLAALRRQGRQALGITPEPAQVAVARARHGDDLALTVTPLEGLGTEHGTFDVMLFQESAQYIQPLAIFEAADRLMNTAGGTMVVMDEFAMRRDSEADFGLHLLPDFKSLAQRFGWRVVHDEDVTAAARPTVDVLLRLVDRWRSRLQEELAVSADMVEGLVASLHRYADHYRSGVYGYHVLRLERSSAPALRPVPVDPAQPERILALFERIFGSPMSVAQWQWKYGYGPSGGMSITRRDGNPVAFYGVLARRILCDGQEFLGCQISDVMVDNAAQEGLARGSSLMFQCMASYVEANVGYARRFAFGFGFPTWRALRVAERLGLYERVDRMVQLRWPALTASPGHSDAPLSVEQPIDMANLAEGTPGWSELAALWTAMRISLPESVLCMRDPSWLRYRYGIRPEIAYECRPVREAATGRAQGLIVLRSHADHVEVIDLIGDLKGGAALIAALRAAYAASRPEAYVKCWITVSHEHRVIDEGDGVIRDELDLYIPANALTRGVPPRSLKDRWFLMAGDTDFR